MDRKEILRYLLTRSTVQDEALNSLIDEIIAEAQRSCTPKSIYRVFDCSVSEDTLTVCEKEFKSRRLAQNLAGCKRVAIMAATLGTLVTPVTPEALVPRAVAPRLLPLLLSPHPQQTLIGTL